MGMRCSHCSRNDVTEPIVISHPSRGWSAMVCSGACAQAAIGKAAKGWGEVLQP